MTSSRSAPPWHSAAHLVRHAPLLWRITRTELKARYAGTLVGPAWAVLAPILLLSLYAVTYTMILKVKVGDLTPAQYVLFIFAGLVPFLATSDALNQAVASVVASRALLANTVFPIDLAPAKAVLLSQVPMTVGFIMVLGAAAAVDRVPGTAILLPVVWGLHVVALVGVCWFVALMNVAVRDLQTLMGVLLLTLLIISPIAYELDMVPPRLRPLVLLNPFAYYVMAYQKVLVLGQVPSAREWAVMTGFSALAFLAGGRFFAAMKRAMIDHV